MNRRVLPMISMVTTCKGRLGYLKRSLPTWLNLDYDHYEIVIVDYDDPDGTRDYILRNRDSFLKQGKAVDIRVKKCENRPFFNLNDARNQGIDAAAGELILLIDSDVLIEKKNLLRVIAAKYRGGCVFFSTQVILNSNYLEAVEIYKAYFQVRIDGPVLIPIGTIIPGLNGTACFDKKIYQEVGKYDPEISRKGYGQDENEFYLRYLSYYFMKGFFDETGASQSIEDRLDRALDSFFTMPLKWFANLENTEEEKDRYYPSSKEESFTYNIRFIRRFFEDFQGIRGSVESTIGRQISFPWTRDIPLKSRSLPVEFKIQWLYLLARKYQKEGEYDKSLETVKKIYYRKQIPTHYKIFCTILLGEVNRSLHRNTWRYYFRKALQLLRAVPNKSPNQQFQVAVLLSELREDKDALKAFKKIANRKGADVSRTARAWFRIADIQRRQGNPDWKIFDGKGIAAFLNSTRLTHHDIKLIAEKYKKIGELRKGIQALQQLVQHGDVDLKMKGEAYYRIGEIAEVLGDRRYRDAYRRSLEILVRQVPHSRLDSYRIASLYKRIGCHSKAIDLFSDLLDPSISDFLRSGVFFHLGELFLREKDIPRATGYFRDCVGINPRHEKAREYIKKLTKGAQYE